MSQTKYIDHLGKITNLVSLGNSVAFVTEHQERRPTSVVVLDLEKATTDQIALDCYGTALLVVADKLWVAGSDSQLYVVPMNDQGKPDSSAKPKSVCELPSPATCLVALSGDRIGVGVSNQLFVLNAKGKFEQTIELGEEALTALATNPTGQWLAIGFRSGKVSVYTCETEDDEATKKSAKAKSDPYQHSATGELHKNAVTSLLFESEELRFFSAAADGTLLLTHARGELEAEDRGRSAKHDDAIQQLVWANEDRFISCSSDKTCKSWARVGSARPATFEKFKRDTVAMAVVSVHQRPSLVLAAGSTLAVVKLDVNGRFLDVATVYEDGYQAVKAKLASGTPAQAGEALNQLADFDDQKSVGMLEEVAAKHGDHKIRFRAVELILGTEHPRSKVALENLLKHEDGPVRVKAFGGLLQRYETGDLEPIRMAIRLGKEDLGKLSVQLLESLATKDELARNELLYALEFEPPGVRQSALLALESAFAKDSPLADIQGTQASKPDVRKLALIRFLQRDMLGLAQVQAVVRRCLEDEDVDVRYTAFQILVATSKKLSATLRAEDPQYHQQMFELESYVPATSDSKAKVPKATKAKEPKGKLSDEDLAPLLTAMACGATDTCLSGATWLAKLGDARALGMLLQLSREKDKDNRVAVAIALEKLAEPRSLQRLVAMLDDEEVVVRDAAYSAIEKICDDDPLFAADAGIKSAFDNVRLQALTTLLKYARKSKKNASTESVVELLLRALNDQEFTVAQEAFKGITNSKLYGKEVDSLRFCLQSVSPKIRSLVLDDAIGSEKEAWAAELILELTDDPDSGLSLRAFDHASQKKKHRDLPILKKGLLSRHAKVRKSAIGRLKSWGTTDAQAAIGTALSDDNPEIRAAAIEALTKSPSKQTTQDLEAAIDSEFDDVRVAAASYFARQGDNRAYDVLVEMANREEPKNSEEKELWLTQAETALKLLGELGDPRGSEVLFSFLENDEERLRRGAAVGLMSVASEEDIPRLTERLQDSDPHVQAYVAAALARLQDRVAMPVVFAADCPLTPVHKVTAALCYEGAAENQFAFMTLDHGELWISNGGLLTLLMRDWLNHDGTPERILACLSARSPRVRLLAADAILAFEDPKQLQALIVDVVNKRGDQKPWEISAEQIEDIASLLVFGSSFVKSHVFSVFETLVESKQHGWNRESQRLLTRFAQPLAEIKKARKEKKLPKPDSKSTQFNELAFGVQVGLVRQRGTGYRQTIVDSLGSSTLAVRLAALRRLVALADGDEALRTAVMPVLVQVLRDPNKEIRELAFESLKTLKMDDTQRATVAIESGVNDLAVIGMNLLVESGASAAAKKALVAVVTQRDGRMAHDAAKILLEQFDVITAATAALESPRNNLRTTALAWLANVSDDNPKAEKLLLAAVDSRYDNVRKAAPMKLADKQHPKAFEMLLNLLKQKQDPREFTRQANALVRWAEGQGKQKETAQALLDLIEDGSHATNQEFVKPVFDAVGSLRQEAVLDQVTSALDQPERFQPAFGCAWKISGYDQANNDPNDELPDREWLKQQHPRRDEVLRCLAERCLDLGRQSEMLTLLPGMRWCLSSECNDLLGKLAFGPDEATRHQSLSACAWRLEKRPDQSKGLDLVLEETISSKDKTSAFLAAEGLAKIGRDDGLTVLMSTCELHESLPLRQRAVLAMGEIASPLSLDLLLRYASQPGHALQGPAAEAVGRYRDSEHQEAILAMLLRYSQSENQQLANRAVVGLRHFDSPEAWERIREMCIPDSYTPLNSVALEQLEFNDTPATRDLVLKLFEVANEDQLYLVARKLFGNDSIEPDVVRAIHYNSWWVLSDEVVQRLQENATVEQLFRIFNEFTPTAYHRPDEFGAPRLDKLAQTVLEKKPLPIKIALSHLSSERPVPVRVSARILGQSQDAGHGKPIDKAVDHWLEKWQIAGDQRDDALQEKTNSVLLDLVQAAAACGSKPTLIKVLEANCERSEFASLRLETLKLLPNVKLAKADLTKLKKLVDVPGVEFQRELLKQIAREDAKLASSLLEAALVERRTFIELTEIKGVDASGVVKDAVRDKSRQSVVLPLLIKEQNTKLLGEVASESKLADSLRFGAIEGLACIDAADSEKQLVKIGKDEKVDEEIRKAAWRGLRRWKRMTGHAKP